MTKMTGSGTADPEQDAAMLSNTLIRRIEWGDCDPAGIVYNPNFFSFFDHGTAMLYEAAGWSKEVMLKKFGATGAPVVETRATFRIPCTFGEDVAITSSVVEIGRSSFKVRHELAKDGEVCVEGFETRVWTVRDPQTGRMKSAPLPQELAERFRAG